MIRAVRHPIRASVRLARFVRACEQAVKEAQGTPRALAVRAQWLHRLARQTVEALGLHVDIVGTPARTPVLVANHLSYLDIVVLASQAPMVFVAKAEVRHWPLLGRLAADAGTLFISRERRGDVMGVADQICHAVEEGVTVAVFPEGTSTDGERVSPFHSSLLEPASRRGWTIQPAHLGYSMAEGSVPEEVCYWRDMTFAFHFLNLLGLPEIRARVALGNPLPPAPDRKALARRARDAVAALAC